MQKYLLERLRNVSCVKNKQKTWVAQLDDEKLWELFLRIRNGESAKAIARHVQQVWCILPESTPHALSQGILKFRRRIAHLLPLTPQANNPELSTDETEPLDTLEGIERIARMQIERINRLMLEENQIRITHTTLSRDIQALAALTRALVKSKDFTVKHEQTDPIKRRQLERRNERTDKRFKNLMNTLGNDGGAAVVAAGDRLLQLCERDALILKVDEAGNHKLVKEE